MALLRRSIFFCEGEGSEGEIAGELEFPLVVAEEVSRSRSRVLRNVTFAIA